MIRAVFFDVGNTLIYPHPSVGEIYSKIAKRHGMSLDGNALDASFKKAFTRHNARPLDDKDYEKQWWKKIVWETLSSFCRPENFDSYFNELFAYFTEAKAWKIYADVTPSLDKLRDKGLVLGVISNWDSRLIPLLDNLKLSPYFSVIAVSALVGSAKPNSFIFEYALEKTKMKPQEVIHIGDSAELDVKGATACGIQPLLIDRKNKSRNKSICQTIKSLESLFSYLS